MPKPAPSTAVVPLHWGNGWGEQGSRMVPADKGVRGLSLGAERPHAPWMGSAAAPKCSSVGVRWAGQHLSATHWHSEQMEPEVVPPPESMALTYVSARGFSSARPPHWRPHSLVDGVLDALSL